MGFKQRKFDLYYKVVPCTAQQVLTFHSQRMEFMPAVPGHIIMFDSGILYKDAGPAFVIGGAGNIQLRYNNTAKTSCMNYAAAGVLDVTTQSSGVVQYPSVGAFVSGLESNAADQAGKSVVSGTAGNADYTGVGGPIVLVFCYRVFPVSFGGIASITQTPRSRP